MQVQEILSPELCSLGSKTVQKFVICLDFQLHIWVTFIFKKIVRYLIHSQSVAIHLKQLQFGELWKYALENHKPNTKAPMEAEETKEI